MSDRGDNNEEAEDLTDLLTTILELTIGPISTNSLEVIKKLLAMAENVSSLTNENLEDLTSTDISDDVTDSILKTSKTASIKRLADGFNDISKLKKSTLDGLNAQLLDTSLKIRPASIHLSDDDVNVTGAARRITHAGAHAFSNTTDEVEDILRSRRSSDLLIVLIDENAEDLSDILTSLVEVLVLPIRGDSLEELDELTTMRQDVHDFILDESHDLTTLDLFDDLVDRSSHLFNTTSLEGISKLLNTISKGKETFHDRLYAEGLDTVSNKLDTIIEIAGHVGDILDASSRITHDNIETISNTLDESKNIFLAFDFAVLIKLSGRSNDKAGLIDCSSRNDQSEKNKSIRTHCY